MDLGLDKLGPQLDKLAKVPRPYRLAMLPVIVAIVGGLYVWLFYLPTASQLEAQKAQQLQLQRRLSEVRAVAENLDKFQQEIETLERKLKVALRQLPDSKELPVLLTDVNTLGKNSGLEIKAFKPSPEVKRDFYAEVPIEIQFNGKFQDIATFFDQVARLPRIVNVNKMAIKIDEENTQETVLAVTGEATTFRFLDESEQAPPPEPAGAKGGKGGAAAKGGKPAGAAAGRRG